ncbi:MAG: hybrid sensor histidine kinase/response regulator [Azospira oryzae]|nr:MAG: hybrid sensor histidine kinase/response regulator [Azospira oryzae]
MRVKWFLSLVFCGIAFSVAFAQPDSYQFTRLDAEDGLSHNRVSSFLKDSRGFMWIGTISGLNRFDGYTFNVFRFDPADTTSIISNSVLSLFEGPEGEIWVNTSEGLVIYNPSTESFSRNTARQFKKYALPAGVIDYIHKDTAGNFWFLHQSLGLFRLDMTTGATVHVEHRPADSTSIVASPITSFKELNNGNLWIMHRNGVLEEMHAEKRNVIYRTDELSDLYQQKEFDYSLTVDNDNDLWIYVTNTQQGVFYFDTSRKQLRSINTMTSGGRLNTNLVTGVAQDNKGKIWIGTDHGGVNLLDKNDFSIRYLLHETEDEKSLSQNSVTSIYKDNEGIIWIGTYKKGVNYYHENVQKFRVYRHSAADASGLSYDDVNRFAEDDKGNLWIGTNGGGLIYFDRAKNTFKTYHHEPGNSNSLSNDVIVSLWIDHEKKLWIGTFLGGLNSFDGKTFTHYKHNAADVGSLSNDSVWEIFEDAQHNLWIGTLSGGLDLFDRKRQLFWHYTSGEQNALKSNAIFALLEDRHQNLWIGTTKGIDLLEKKTGRFIHYEQNNSRKGSLSNNSVLSLLEDSRGRIWIGTQEGLNCFNQEKNTFRTFRKEDGLPHNTILTLLEDDDHHLWIGTPNGLSHLTEGKIPGEFTFKNYDELDGLQGREFNENAALKTRKGELIFGGANGFSIFNPREIGFNKQLPRVVLTNFEIFNQEVKIGEKVNGDVIIRQSISETKEIQLKHKDNVFSIEFAALNFLHPQKNKYKYKLENFDQDWTEAGGTSRRVTYTNLNPGEYTFRVMASNNDGYWNEEGVRLQITILPPFWKSSAAMFIYVLLIIAGLIISQQIILQRERMNVRLEQEHQEAQRMKELDIMKTKFFTNVSHEFRTPLSLILTPIEKMLKSATDDEQKNQFQVIHRNARRLLTLVNQLLDFRRLEVQEIKYNPSEGDVIQFIHDTVFSFSDISEKKHIRLEFHSALTALETLFDQDKLEKILFNLLSNAFKFTPEGGFVIVEAGIITVDSGNTSLAISVKDSGIGIPKEKQEKVFERFFQHDIPGTMMNQGSGIGLSITKEFVRIHGGTIRIESEPEKGSCFTVTLPVTEIKVEAGEKDAVLSVEEFGQYESDMVAESKQPLLLLVEDNEDFRFYLKDNLKQTYQIAEARNGAAAFEMALSVVPDLIVSDVMMPGMNGIELCRKVKTDPRTSHIAVILLTARASEEQKMEGFDAGANDYITKPFNFELLQSRIKNLIRQQEQQRKTFQNQWIEVKPGHVEVTSLDEKLIQKAMEVVERNISNPDFSVEELSRELSMSRVNLYKKLLSITGHAPMEFIRIIRLKRAAQLLEKSQLTVAEVAYQVGFNNPKYFTKYFKNMFKILPSAYAESKK